MQERTFCLGVFGTKLDRMLRAPAALSQLGLRIVCPAGSSDTSQADAYIKIVTISMYSIQIIKLKPLPLDEPSGTLPTLYPEKGEVNNKHVDSYCSITKLQKYLHFDDLLQTGYFNLKLHNFRFNLFL